MGIDPVLATQAIGGVGFLLLIAATFARSRRGFFVVDLLGLAPVAIHYALLNAMAGLVFSAFYMGVDVVTWWLGERYRRLTAWALYPLVLLLTWAFWEGPGDIVATAGTVLAIAARQQREVWRIQAIIAASTCCWGTYGYLVESWPQVAFSALYGGSAVFNAIRYRPRP